MSPFAVALGADHPKGTDLPVAAEIAAELEPVRIRGVGRARAGEQPGARNRLGVEVAPPSIAKTSAEIAASPVEGLWRLWLDRHVGSVGGQRGRREGNGRHALDELVGHYSALAKRDLAAAVCQDIKELPARVQFRTVP